MLAGSAAAGLGCEPAARPPAVPSGGEPAPSDWMRTAPTSKKKVLILGGTAFLGPEIVHVAEARGHTLTLFNRGKTNPQLFPNIEKLHGDRKTSDLKALEGRTWDVVIDTSGYFPRLVGESAALLKNARQYIFVSSVSVYDKPPLTGADESSPVGTLTDPSVEVIDEKTYGPLKAACERAAEEKMPGRVTVVRPGLIVGPGDPSDRFTYWPVRLAAGGEVMAPGAPPDPVQVIDARDLGAWIVHVFETETMGIFNTAGPAKPIGVGEMLAEVQAGVSGAPGAEKASLTWVDAAFLEEKKVEGWSDMPVWVPPTGEDAGISRMSSARAIAKGLTFRPIRDTARDTLAWWRTLPEERRQKPKSGLSREREREVLAAFHARAAK